MEKNLYLTVLNELKDLMMQVENTHFTAWAKVVTLVTMNMRYEKVAFNKNLSEHPYLLTKKTIENAKNQFKYLMDVSFIESDDKSIKGTKSQVLEKKHIELWQEIWTRHNEREFQEFINLKRYRLEINNLQKYILGKQCIDFGCGNGSFSFAMIELGADHVTGIDFGESSITYCNFVREEKKLQDKTKFIIAEVFNSKFEEESFDFAVSNGVFHHLSLENMEKAVMEVSRVLRKGGWFWYYIDGIGAISMDLFDTSVEILKEIPVIFIENVLINMNVKRNKMVHLVDGLNATYKHSSWEETIDMLSKYGFGNFRRLIGGTSTDFDLDVIKQDSYGIEKFGEGDLRILCQLVQ